MKTAGIVLLILLGVLLLILFLGCAFVFNQLVWRKTIPVPKFIEKMIAGNETADTVYEADAKTAKAEFCALPREDVVLTAPDGAKLIGRVLIPEHPNGRTMLLCHGARSSGLGEYRFMAPYLYKNGYTLVIPIADAARATENIWATVRTNPKIPFCGCATRRSVFPKTEFFC